MNINWTAIGSIAALIAVAATFVVFYFQTRRDKAAAIQNDIQEKAAAIRQNIQFIHGQQAQVLPLVKSGLLALIDRQIREFRERLGPSAAPSYLLQLLFGGDQSCGERFLFLASALDSNLSSTAYSRMSNIWDGMDIKARELRGAFRVFSYTCQVLTQECRLLCDPRVTIGILDTMAEHGDREALDKIHSIDELVDRLLSGQIALVESGTADTQRRIEEIAQGCFFIGMLADLTLHLSDEDLVTLAANEVEQPSLDMLIREPRKAIEGSLGYLEPPLLAHHMAQLKDVLVRWDPQPDDAQLTLGPPETGPPQPSRATPDMKKGATDRPFTC